MIRIFILILVHAFGDFFFQSNKMDKQKATKFRYLLEHVGIYTLLFVLVSPFLLGLTFTQGLFFGILNGILHLIVDFFTSKFKQKQLSKGQFKYIAFVCFDHFLHLILLIGTYVYLYPDAFRSVM